MEKDINVEIQNLVKAYGIKQILTALIDHIVEVSDEEDYLHKLASGLTTTLIEYENRYVINNEFDEL